MAGAAQQTKFTEKPSILFIDDEPSILMAVRVVFRLGYNVTVTTDGNEALEHLRKQRYHVIVSDQRMPNMTGVQLLEQARQISPNTVRILLTGYSDSDAILSAINDVEVHRFLQKPWDNTKLKQVIDESISLAMTLFDSAPASEPAPPPALAAVPKKSADIIQLPLIGPAETLSANTVAPAESAHKTEHEEEEEVETVLIIDNKPDVYTEAKKGLAGKVHVMHAANMTELFAILAKESVSVIACAFDPQSEADRVFLQMLKKEHPYIIVIAICDSTDSPRLIELINQARIFRFIRKPVSLGLLSRYITSAVHHVKEIKANPILIGKQASEELSDEIKNSAVTLKLRDHFARANQSLSTRFAKFMGIFKAKRV